MAWIEGKLDKLKKESISSPYIQGRRKPDFKIGRKERMQHLEKYDRSASSEESSCDEEERRLIDSIERLKSQEQNLTQSLYLKKERQKERSKRRQQRIKELKEKERCLEESLLRKENMLDKMESSEEEEYNGHEVPKHRKVERRQKEDRLEKTRTGVSLQRPTIPKLSEDSFEEWKIEIEFIIESGLYHEEMIQQKIRNSLTGNTRKILLNIPPNISSRDLLLKLENLYGNIRSGESILAEFYKSKQEQNENVTEWGVRVESLLNTSIRKGQLMKSQADEMLRKRFWRYLKSEKLKNATRLYFESARDFEELRRNVRIKENEIEAETEVMNVRCQQMKDRTDQIEFMNKLLERMAILEEKLEKQNLNRTKEDRTDRDKDNVKENYYGRGRWN